MERFLLAGPDSAGKGTRPEDGELAGNRTQDPRLKRALLYQLSYELSPFSTYLDSIS